MFLQTKEKENLLKPLFQYLSYNINRKKEKFCDFKFSNN